MQGLNVELLQEKWSPILNHEGLGSIDDAHKRMVTSVLLENQEKAINEEREFLSEAPTNATGSGVANFDPVLISLIRRAMPNLVAYDLAGVQPMNGPTGLIFAMRSRYTNQSGTEALFDEALSGFSGVGTNGTHSTNPYVTGSDGASDGFGKDQAGNNPGVLDPNDASSHTVGQGMDTSTAEGLGEAGNAFQEMAFSIEKVTVTAKSRALKAEYSLELAQDLKAIHGLNAELSWQTSCQLRSSQKSTVKSSEPSIRLLKRVPQLTLLPQVNSTSTLTATVVGLLRSSRV